MEKKIWLITGISSGLGKALADAVIKKGDFLLGTFRRKAQVEEFNQQYAGKAFSYLLDISNTKRIEQVVAEISDKFGKVDVLVNNAGIGFVGAIEETSQEESRAVFETNFFGVLKLTQSILPLMRKQKGSHIVQISSHGGIKAFAGFGIYNASKFALEGFSEAMAQEIAPLGIKTTIVEPGPFRTQFASTSLGEAEREIADYDQTAGMFRNKLKSVHGKQEGDPVKAAEAILAHVEDKNSSLRLALGKTALTTIGMKIESLTNDLEKNKTITESVVF